MITRRIFVASASVAPTLVFAAACRSFPSRRHATPADPPVDPGPGPRFSFVSQGKIGLMNADGTGLRYLDFHLPNQASWQAGAFFPDGRRVLLLSMEPRRDGPGRPFAEYYTQTPTHLWIYDLENGALEEIATRDRLAVFYTPQLLLPNGRLLVQVVRHGNGQVFSMNLDGSDPREFTRVGEGLPYGLNLSPDGRRVAFHLASPMGYQIWTCDPEGDRRSLVASEPEHLYFGPAWSPDGAWLAFQDCRYLEDPGHDWCDIRLCRPDGSEARMLTQGQAMWFGATYGHPGNRGGGSNTIAWTHDGAILFPRRLPGARVPWEFQAQRPDVDHFNRDFKPERARGGTEICRLDPHDGSHASLTTSEPPVWDFRASPSPEGRWILFCRAATGGVPALWIVDAGGRNARLLTHGPDRSGADHPRWIPAMGSHLYC